MYKLHINTDKTLKAIWLKFKKISDRVLLELIQQILTEVTDDDMSCRWRLRYSRMHVDKQWGVEYIRSSKFHFTYIHYLCMSVNANYKSVQNVGHSDNDNTEKISNDGAHEKTKRLE